MVIYKLQLKHAVNSFDERICEVNFPQEFCFITLTYLIEIINDYPKDSERNINKDNTFYPLYAKGKLHLISNSAT